MKTVEQIKYSNQLRDKIIEIIEDKCFAENRKETPTPLSAVYPLLHFFEAELHEYGTKMQGKVLDLTHELEDSKYEIETMRGQIIDRDMEIKELKEDLEELSDTLGLRNRSNPDLTIDPETDCKSVFDRWRECKD